jgi:hypothetical protein
MPGSNDNGPGASLRERAQIQLVLENFPEARPYPPDWESRESGVDYLYRKDSILVRDASVERVTRRDGIEVTPDTSISLAGVTRMTITEPDDDPEWLNDLLDAIEADEGPGAAAREHLFYVCNHSCAAIEPEEVAKEATPVPCWDPCTDQVRRGGAGVHVRVLDTGLVPDAARDHVWMSGISGDVENPYLPDRTIKQDGGHGTFTAGCVRLTAPAASVRVVNAAVPPMLRSTRRSQLDDEGLRELQRRRDEQTSGALGAAFESDLADHLRRQLVADDGRPPIPVPDVIVLNFAGTTQSARPPVALAALYDTVIQHLAEPLILSPAGNEGDQRKNWPASFDWVVSVGALAGDGSRAPWSNHGRSVDVYAPGDRLVNAYATGTYRTQWERVQETRTFTGMALWSGTSFSTPLVAGLVAARMSSTGQSSKRAWASLLELAERQAVPGIGPVLYPGQELD